MATIIGLTAAIFNRSKTAKLATRTDHEGSMFWNPQAIFIPRRKKFKGYMRDNRNWGKKRTA